MVIFETKLFSRQIAELLDDEEYRQLQEYLCSVPDAGDLIKGSGGLRKIRWRRAGSGKRGGIRAVYYWLTNRDQLFMLAAYAKSDQADMTPKQLEVLSALVAQELADDE